MTIRILDGYSIQDVARELEVLNSYVDPNGKFHTPIPCNPDSETDEGFLGIANTAPVATPDGTFCQVQISGYEWVDLGFLPSLPTTFSIIACGMPPVKQFV